MERIEKKDNSSYASVVIRTAGAAAKMTLAYGGGAKRAEEVYTRMCCACGIEKAQISAISTSITVSAEYEGENYTSLFRVERRGVNLTKLDMINQVSRLLSEGKITLEEANTKINETDRIVTVFDRFGTLAAGFSSAFFSLLLGGGLWEFVLTFVIGALIGFVLSFFEKANSYSFVNNLFGGIIDGGLAAGLYCVMLTFGITVNLEPIVVGAMMPLLPGLAATNAVRDTISGDYVSGVAGTLEALSMAVALAAGVAFSMGIFVLSGVNL